MKLDVTTLRKVSPLLDEAMDLEGPQRDAWFARLEQENPAMATILRDLLKKQASAETNDFLERGPEFTPPIEDRPTGDYKPGDTVGPYRLIRELGVGGMGEVWLAERSDGVLKRHVALKLPMLSLKRSVLVQRFERERDILASLTHPNIARLYDAGFTESGQPYLALEYVEGEPITEFASKNTLDTRARIGLLLQVMNAVQYAHANLVIHRDLKPANVLVSSDGKVHLLDFGIAKLLEDEVSQAHETELTRLGGRALTLSYAAPEQITGSPISTATDVYALGVLLYEVLTEGRPFNGSKHEIEQAILNAEPQRPKGLPEDLTSVVLKALKKNPAERYATINGFATDLENWLQGNPVSAQPDRLVYRLRKFVGRHRVGVVSTVVVSCALVASTAVSVWQATIAKRESQTAAAVEEFLQSIFNTNSSEQSDPEKARRTTARELLDIGAQRVATELAEAPQAKLRVLSMLARMYDDLTLAEPALALYRQKVDLLRKIEPANSEKLALGLTEIGSHAAEANSEDQSRAAFDEARAIFDGRGDTTTFERGIYEMKRAEVMRERRDPNGLETAKRAVSILKNFPTSAELLSAMEAQSFMASDLGDVQGSLVLMRSALALAPEVHTMSAHMLVGLHLELAGILNKDYQIGASESSRRTAYDLALAKEGPDSHLTLNVALELGHTFYNNGEFAQALAMFGPAGSSAQRALAKGDRTWLPLLLVAYQGVTKMKMGNLEEGLEILTGALSARDILDANPVLDTALHSFAAEALAVRGAHAAAEAELDESRKVMIAKMDGNIVEARELTFARLRCAVIWGDRLLARELLEQANLSVVVANEAPNAALRRLVRLAEALFAAGELPDALASSRQLIDILPQSTASAYDGDRERRASLIAAKVLVLQKTPTEAIALLQRAVSLAEGRLDTQLSPHHADALIWLGMAQLSVGRVDAARQLAKQAKQIHDRHAQLAETFRKPLADLNSRLKLASHS